MATLNQVKVSREENLTTTPELLQRQVEEIVQATPVTDMHTHLFAPQFGVLNLWGIDNLLNYHYLIAELFRSFDISAETYWQLGRAEQADLIWETLFVRNTPLSEATRGVVAVLSTLGLDPRAKNLQQARGFFKSQNLDNYLDQVLRLSNVSDIVMTNDPFDESEVKLWDQGLSVDPRFHAALRLDPILNDWTAAAPQLGARGYKVRDSIDAETSSELRRFLDEWIARMGPLYLAVSLPDSFAYPDNSARTWVLRDVVLPACVQHDLPLSLMIGVRRNVNRALRSAGDGLGRADMTAVHNICSENPKNRFLITMLSRENQHELCVAARKFSNLLPFGCWWFLNNPSIVHEICSERIELLGTRFVAQHSDARILDQLIYKWKHARRSIAGALVAAYSELLEDGRPVTREEIKRDARQMLSGNFREWVGLPQGN
ncbi:MAG TPA: glucuronate isomerase [Acidobacteriota bacterium]|jgi:hypothetical protein